MESKERTWLNWKHLVNDPGTLTALRWPTHEIIKTPEESHRLCNKAHKWMVTESRICETAVYIKFFLLDCRYTLITVGGAVFPLSAQSSVSPWSKVYDVCSVRGSEVFRGRTLEQVISESWKRKKASNSRDTETDKHGQQWVDLHVLYYGFQTSFV